MPRSNLIILLLPLLYGKSCQSQHVGQGIDHILKSYVDSGFSGVALVVKNNQVILDKAYGYANDELKTPNTIRTLFNTASIGKQFTAVIVMKLEEKRLLNTKDYIGKYVGKLGGFKDSATIENLLMHNSGLFVDGTELDYSSRNKFIESVRNSALESKPGEKHRYSNAGYTLLAAIVEIVTGQPFETVLYKMIFQPAGMIYTAYPWETRVKKVLLATGYAQDGKVRPAEQDIWGNRGPGHLVTNNHDMLQWHRAWFIDSLITPAIKQKMLADHIPTKETFSWNKTITAGGKKLLYKGGGRPDFESQTMWWPDEKVFVFFSINRDINLRRLIYRDVVSYMDKN